jgi:two-component sensor histidine kinase
VQTKTGVHERGRCAALRPFEMRIWERFGLRRSSEGLLNLPRIPASSLYAPLLVSCLVATATAIRLVTLLLFGNEVLSYATYYPAVLIIALVVGTWWAIVAMFLGGVAAYYLFVPPFLAISHFTTPNLVSFFLYIFACAAIVAVAAAYRTALDALARERDDRALMMKELDHRMRNTAAIIQAGVSFELGRSPQAARINQRIRSVVATNYRLHQPGEGDDVKSVIESELAGFGVHQFTLSGPFISVAGHSARVLSLIAHELCTNAVKYGALSVPEGQVRIQWGDQGEMLVIHWDEQNGPVVYEPRRAGFGTSLLRQLVEREGGAISFKYEPNGLRVDVQIRR